MTQNTSSAVMARRIEPHDSLDHFPTPPWAARALCEHVIKVRDLNVWEPACGNGDMTEPLGEYAKTVFASDVHDYGWGHCVHDFLMPFKPLLAESIDWVITNPPFRLGEQFVRRALEVSNVAMLVRSVFIESVGRYENLFSKTPPAVMAQFVERVPMVKGRLDKTASTATSYCWLVWYQGVGRHTTRLQWIPPCRAKLEKPGDYRAMETD